MNPAATAASRARYFFLSYVPVLSLRDRIQGDHWVRRFYHDLNSAIADQPGPRLRRQGFADFTVRPHLDRLTEKRIALAEAEVFVPLYSPEYLDRAESTNEREAFRRKLINAGRPPDGENLLPILWNPLPASVHAGDRVRALAVAGESAAYVAHGMSALCRLQTYHRDYETVLRRIARHIVDTAERAPLGWPDLGGLDLGDPDLGRPEPEPVEPSAPRPSEVPFVTVVIAPGSGVAHHNGRVAARAERWQPFQGHQPVVTDVVAAVHRLRMPLEIREFAPGGGLFEGCPGLLVVDARIVAADGGHEVLRAAAECLRGSVGVAVLADSSAADHHAVGAVLLDEVLGILAVTATPVAFTSYEDWRAGVHGLVDRLRRRYLDETRVYPPRGPSTGRPRLSDGRRPPSGEPDDQHRPGRTE